MEKVVMVLRRLWPVALLGVVACATVPGGPKASMGIRFPTDWPALVPRTTAPAGAASASVPLPADGGPGFVNALEKGHLTLDGMRVQCQPVAWWEGRTQPRRVMLRWLPDGPVEAPGKGFAVASAPEANAGWSFAYHYLEGNGDDVPWKVKLRNAPLEETQYEMYQLDLGQGDRKLGLRLGLKTDKRIYWWQFLRADFIQRGPVFDVLRAGGPIYNEESSIHSDLYLILYRNGAIEAYAHFVNNQRESVGTDTHGIPVLAIDAPGASAIDLALDGSTNQVALGAWQLGLGQAARYATPRRPASIRTLDGVAVWQPWQDQEIYGELLAEAEGIPDHRIVHKGGPSSEHGIRTQADEYWVAAFGDKLIPKGVARNVRFTLSPKDVPPLVARYDAPAWWHARCRALPTEGLLPVSWWAVPHALAIGEDYFNAQPNLGPFELGRSSRSSDGTLGAAMIMLGTATDQPRYLDEALPAAYWWADVATDHVDFVCHEIPKYSWQWIVPPYIRWIDPVYAYWETSDPYLLDTARFTADSWNRFFWTNRPHRTVGRDALALSCMLSLYETTGEVVYLDRTRDVLAEIRRSYGQTDIYWPGHQAGVGPNGIGRMQDWDYIPMLLARLHCEYLNVAGDHVSPAEADEMLAYVKRMCDVVSERGGTGWVMRAVAHYYTVVPVLVERSPLDASKWIERLSKWNVSAKMPDTHDGGKPFDWVQSAVTLDAWAWGATWKGGTLHVKPQAAIVDSHAPKEATVFTPAGVVRLAYNGKTVEAVSGAKVKLKADMSNLAKAS